MIRRLFNTPANIAAFEATGDVTQSDFDVLVIPAVKEKVLEFGELNYLLVLNTDLKNFTIGAWWKDALLGIKNIANWNRAAIVTDKEAIISFTDVFSIVVPGEFKGFEKSDLEKAIEWVSTGK